MAMSQAKMFVSYARDDFKPTIGGAGRVIEMYEYIRQRLQIGSRRSLIQSLRDNETVVSEGDNYRISLEDAICDCDFALVIQSQYYIKSSSCLWELETLLREGKPIHVAEMENVRAYPELSKEARMLLDEQKCFDYTQFWRIHPMGE